MMKKNRIFRIFTAWAAAAGLFLATSCTSTSYDAYGRPVETIDPVKTGLAVAAVSAVGYAIAKNSDRHHGHRSHYRGNHYGHDYGHSGYSHGSGRGYGNSRYCR